MADAPASKPAFKPKPRRPVCALCQGPYKTAVVVAGQKLCRFCFSRVKREAAASGTSPKDDREEKGEQEQERGTEEEGEFQSLCEEHREDLTWFCTKEKALLCETCKASEAHASHSVVPVEDAAQEYQDKVHSQKERVESEFAKLYNFLVEEEEELLQRLKAEERQTLKRLDRNLTRLSKQNSSLKQLVKEIKSKSQKAPAELLKDVENVLARTENVTLFEPEVVPTELKNVYNIPCLDMIQILTKFKVDVSLDPTTAHPSLLVSTDRKSVEYRGSWQLRPPDDNNNTERFDTYVLVLGSEAFTSGRHYWEVEVGDSPEWDLGVCRESVSRKGQQTIFSPISGYWRLWLRKGDQYKALISCPTLLPVNTRPKRVGVFLDYSEGEVSFYDVTERTHIYTYIGTFCGPLRPFFSPSRQQKGANGAHPLLICPGPKARMSKKTATSALN
ncbi:E3 ubiquitin-protein ligase TRIM58-like isoform X2 [Zootoca vivipara]|uniref:E3 ubiquitin-protein ligase TRIM58-like isoform X2 n=1 Tax=Zootoca vivipara TaxID=8524 RepID=UPI00293BF468|nr:E3 ubiquitin-protein ligase TRIM58-like isoform X2 [Zootoca vivipara]